MEASTATETPGAAPEAVTEAPTSPEAEPEGTEQTTPEAERDETGKFLSHEAAGYRRRLREAEAERDQLREQLERLQRAEVERLASSAGLAVASDVWLHGASLNTLRTDTGDIDAETVTGLVADIVKDRPGLRAVQVGDLGIGRGATAAGRAPVASCASQSAASTSSTASSNAGLCTAPQPRNPRAALKLPRG